MKNNSLIISAILILLLSLNSCGKLKDKNTEIKNEDTFHLTDTLKIVIENAKITEFRAFTMQLDSVDVTSTTKAVQQYTQSFTGQSTLLCDSGFVVFQAFYDKLEQNLSNIHQNDTTNYEPLLSDNQASLSKKLKDYRKKMWINGFKISVSEGVTYIEQDRNFVAKNFYSLVTPTMREYLTELQKENSEGFALDGVITISPPQLVERNLWYEKFIAENPTFVFLQNCKDYQKAYFSYLLRGYEKTALYVNNDTKELSFYYKAAYNILITKHKDTQTAQLVAPYYEAIKQKQAAKAESLLKDYHIKGLIFSAK